MSAVSSSLEYQQLSVRVSIVGSISWLHCISRYISVVTMMPIAYSVGRQASNIDCFGFNDNNYEIIFSS
jgi:hypothetical protein